MRPALLLPPLLLLALAPAARAEPNGESRYGPRPPARLAVAAAANLAPP